MSNTPTIQTTTVGSYPIPEWLQALPSEQALVDATRVVFDTQRQAGIDLPTDGELYRFDINHPDTNGMIEYFVRPMGGTQRRIWPPRGRGVRRQTKHGLPSQARGRGGSRTRRGQPRPVRRLRPRRSRGRRSLQVHPDQSLHAGPHPPRSPLRRLCRALDGRCPRPRRPSPRPTLLLHPNRRGQHPRQPSRRPPRRPRHQRRTRQHRRRHPKGRPLLLWQLREARPSSRASGAPCSTFSTSCAPITWCSNSPTARQAT